MCLNEGMRKDENVEWVKRNIRVFIGIVIALALCPSPQKIAKGESPGNQEIETKSLAFSLSEYFGFEVAPYKADEVVDYIIFRRSRDYLRVLYDLNAPPDKQSFFTVEVTDERIFETLAAALNDKHVHNRLFSVLMLGAIKDARAVTPLFIPLKDEQPIIRKAAAEALGGKKDSRAVPPLIETLKDKEMHVRKTTAWALGEIKDSRATKSLIGALEDEDWFVQKEVVQALIEITGKDFGDDQQRWQEWWEKEKAHENKR